jgi:hypothetical protein
MEVEKHDFGKMMSNKRFVTDWRGSSERMRG